MKNTPEARLCQGKIVLSIAHIHPRRGPWYRSRAGRHYRHTSETGQLRRSLPDRDRQHRGRPSTGNYRRVIPEKHTWNSRGNGGIPVDSAWLPL